MQPKHTHFCVACNETTLGALSASTSTAFSPTHHRNSQSPVSRPPRVWSEREPNCIARTKSPCETGNGVGNTLFFVIVALRLSKIVMRVLCFEYLILQWVILCGLKRKEYVELEFYKWGMKQRCWLTMPKRILDGFPS